MLQQQPGEAGVAWPLLLSTLAGLSTSVGAAIAVTLAPDESTLAFLLGSAIGVMSAMSVLELWVHKAVAQGDWLGITCAVAAGAALFCVLDALLPKAPELQHAGEAGEGSQQQPGAADDHAAVKLPLDSHVTLATSVKRQTNVAPRSSWLKLGPAGGDSGSSSGPGSSSSSSNGAAAAQALLLGGNGGASAAGAGGAAIGASVSSVGSLSKPLAMVAVGACDAAADSSGCMPDQQLLPGMHHAPTCNGSGGVLASLQLLRAHHANLMRLGVVMALTMTAHNLPEGFAVAFSAHTSAGLTMCAAIAAHNIPEGLVIAAPIYAATGSKARAVVVATASGLSEPLGALLALFVFRPFITSLARLDYLLAAVGGVMLAVCAVELWPEGRKCERDTRLAQGVGLGALLMAWTLWAGV